MSVQNKIKFFEEKISNSKLQQLPYFIITAGATGSGKTQLITETMKHLGIEREKLVKILIDDLVENDDIYKLKIIEIYKGIKEECAKNVNEDPNCEELKYNNPSPELYKKFNDAYFETRYAKRCEPQKCKSNCNNLLSFNEINDQNLKNAIKENTHIVFEYTGSYIPHWLLNPSWITEKYNVVIAYSLVTLDNLVQRNKSRAYKAMREFQTDHNNPAPRLPDVSKENFKKIVSNIYDILINLYDLCIVNYDKNKEDCGQKKIDQLLIFDNNGSSMKSIYNSKEEKEKLDINNFKKLIDPYFGLSSESSSKKKYLKYKNKYLNLKNSIYYNK